MYKVLLILLLHIAFTKNLYDLERLGKFGIYGINIEKYSKNMRFPICSA